MLNSYKRTSILIISLILLGCKYFRMDLTDPKLKVMNNSVIELGALVNIYYPDTSITKTQNYFLYPNEKGSIGLLNRSWERTLEKKGKITIYFVDWNELKKYDFQSKKKYKILKRYILTKSYLDSLNWTLTFP